MALTGTFGNPGVLDTGSAIATVAQPVTGTQGKYESFRDHFPVGFMVDMAETDTIVTRTGTATITPNNAAAWPHIINNPYVGALANNLNYIIGTNGVPRHHEETQGISNLIESLSGGKVYYVPSVYGWTSALSGLNPETQFWPDAADHSDADALPFATDISSVYSSMKNILAFNVADDVNINATNKRADHAVTLIRQLSVADPYGRPGICMLIPGGAEDVVEPGSVLGAAYAYPHGYYWSARTTAQGVGDDSESPEGEFWCRHNSDFHLILRSIVDGFNANRRVPVWWMVQAHKTESGGGGRLRYPTPRELIADCWLCIGEGIKGLFGFTWSTQSANWDGLNHPNGALRLAALSSISRRLTPRIRTTLLGLDRVEPLFVTTGGGSTDPAVRSEYASAYVSTLQDVVDGTLYVVVLNRGTGTNPQTITIDGDGVSGGTLTNLETGTVTALGGTVSLGPLDGSIWRWSPSP